MVATHEFVLLHAENVAERENTLRSIPVPAHPSHLLTGPRRRPRLTPRRPRLSPGIVLEPISTHHQRFLLMLVGDGARAQHNGQPAGPVTLLRIRDEVHVAGHRFFVSVQRTSGLATPEDRHIGATCPFCRLQIANDTRVFACACGTVLHCEDERWPAESRLGCAEMASNCPNCKQPINFEDGLEWQPAL